MYTTTSMMVQEGGDNKINKFITAKEITAQKKCIRLDYIRLDQWC